MHGKMYAVAGSSEIKFHEGAKNPLDFPSTALFSLFLHATPLCNSARDRSAKFMYAGSGGENTDRLRTPGHPNADSRAPGSPQAHKDGGIRIVNSIILSGVSWVARRDDKKQTSACHVRFSDRANPRFNLVGIHFAELQPLGDGS
ncbi:hypothetical protein I7I51_04680 [Histoplasma capsulatum]|uniref:Uncharacterized protein n=2 Tax=Histoplasma TaxID=5036 RepID=A0A8A1M5F4_AJECA|nr:hypothetical protein I7I51_04680 [Histoplasma capsulatum]